MNELPFCRTLSVSRSHRLLAIAASILSVAVVCAHGLFAQIPQPSVPDNILTAADPIGAVPNVGTDGTHEQVDLESGALNMFIPVLTLPQRNGSPLTLGFTYSSHYFDLYQTVLIQNVGSETDTPAYDQLQYSEAISSQNPTWPLQINLPLLQSSVEYEGDQVADCTLYSICSNPSPQRLAAMFCVTNWTFTDWSGSKHVFGNPDEPALTNCNLQAPGFIDPSINYSLSLNSHTYLSADGSGLVLNLTNPCEATVTTLAGTVYHFPGDNACDNIQLFPASAWTPVSNNTQLKFNSTVSSIIDKNSNTITVGAPTLPGYTDSLTDTVGRVINVGSTGVQYYDSNGTSQTVTVATAPSNAVPSFTNSSPAGWPDYQQSTASVCSIPSNFGDPPPATQFMQMQLANNLPEAPGSSNMSLSFSGTNRKYIMQFDQDGKLLYIRYPEGGYTRYDYTASNYGKGMGLVNCLWDSIQVAHKYECSNATGPCAPPPTNGPCSPSTSECLTTYQPQFASYLGPINSSNTVVDPFGTTTTHGFASLSPGLAEGPESSTKTVNSTGITVQSTQSAYNNVGAILLTNQWVTNYDTAGSPVATKETVYTWDTYPSGPSINEQTGISVYGYNGTVAGQTPTGSPLSNKTIQYNHSFPLALNIRNVVQIETVTDETNGNTVTTTYGADSIGNVTTKTVQGTGTPQYLTQYTTPSLPLDPYGRPQTIIDPNGNQSFLSYLDNPGDTTCSPGGAGSALIGGTQTAAFLTKETNALGQITVYKYNSCTGTIASVTDPNSNITSYTYDPLGRATNASYPDGGNTQVGYNDTPPNSVTTTVTAMPDPAIVSSKTLDGFGRPSITTEANGATSETTYDAVGRIASATNPHFTSSSTTDGTTYFAYDALDRKISQTQPDQNTLTWCYDGPSGSGPNCSSNKSTLADAKDWVDSTDESGRHWQHSSDALGRLLQVTEPDPVSGSLALPTVYTYNGFGDLTGVSQTGNATLGEVARSRSFTYDSLSRLVQSDNPEAGWVCYGTTPSAAAANGTNCTPGYDANGNLLHKIDASGIDVDYTYDALNRMLTKYSAFENASNFSFIYDQGANGIGRLSEEEDTLTNGFLLSGTQFQYDQMGRVTSTNWGNYAENQGVYPRPYTQQWDAGMQVLYDKAGNPIQLTYPDSRIVSQAWDGAGRLLNVYSGPLGGSGAFYASGMQYWASGALQNATLGNGVTESITLNNRLQPCHSAASSSLFPSAPSGGNLLDRQLYYASPVETNCLAATANNGNIRYVLEGVGSAYSQTFSYDGLNRLTQAYSVNRPAATTYDQDYNYDSFGNMVLVDQLHGPLNFGIDPATNRLTLNSSDFGYNPNGTLAWSPNGVGGYHTYMWTGEGYLRAIDGYGVGSYLYDSMGERTLAVQNNDHWNEYVYLNSQPMADLDSSGVWTDYIYANGQKIARATSSAPVLHLSGNCGNCSSGNSDYTVSSLATFLSGYTIQSGDRLIFRQKQDGPAQAGLYMYATDGTNSMGSLVDTAGNWINSFNDDSNTWQTRIVDLSSWAGKQISNNIGVSVEDNTAPGQWDSWITDVALVSSNGTSIPVYSGQTYGGTAWNPQFGSSVFSISTDSDPAVTAHYYLADQVGTTQVELAAGGWPIWEGYFTPFGQEIENGSEQLVPGQVAEDGTANRYKFTGKERDQESGNDYFGARYYASTMGRFMSPDWSEKPEPVPYSQLDDPQSLNLYIYGMNNPLTMVDDDGHFSTDTYVADIDKHGGVHIDRYNKGGQNVGRYRRDGSPMRFKGRTPKPVPNSDKDKFDAAKAELDKKVDQRAKADTKDLPPPPPAPLPDALKPDPVPTPSPDPAPDSVPVVPAPPSPGTPTPTPTPAPTPEPMPEPMPIPMPELIPG